ncbi:ABC transporter ATP-binding protein [Variovorax dokdonensis]|uniref:ABC transporter ATP-binding protein n=1 Tax=Variovorax dokdonensis TaxID=344883 RepID=A0ABT7NDW7_9BURK|nr:ABC transporter ATP-binding protein [Variovorax dokdonensis]MDM0046128.1 ABC transporter ATP-binding protein [Variovorax dokdonensis]
MQLSLERVTKKVGAQTWLYEMSIAPRPGAVTVLLGATQSGKTSLMRLMAGLDAPSSGRVLVDGKDVTGVPVRERNVAMVYQQFINYPSLTVARNIASPLRLRGARHVDEQVNELADKLHISAFLDRYPSELSGGQQQRVALARALAKNAPLMLLDEPLVNLDYKLREELREELAQIFAAGESTVIYATTEPGEALLLGGHTAVLDAGELLQYGPTAEVFHAPRSLRVARAFSDPPMNLLPGKASSAGVQLGGGLALPLDLPPEVQGDVTVGLRASALTVGAGHAAEPGGVELAARIVLAEIAGSDTFVHLESPAGELVAQLTGVHRFALGELLVLRFNLSQLHVFDAAGDLVLAPHSRKTQG